MVIVLNFNTAAVVLKFTTNVCSNYYSSTAVLSIDCTWKIIKKKNHDFPETSRADRKCARKRGEKLDELG